MYFDMNVLATNLLSDVCECVNEKNVKESDFGFKPFILSVFFCVVLLMPGMAIAQDDDPFVLYQRVLSGQIKVEQLTQNQKQMVLYAHSLIAKDICDGCSEDCRDAREQAGSSLEELKEYTENFLRCLTNNDLTDGCDSEFRRVKSSHSDFESSVSNVQGECD